MKIEIKNRWTNKIIVKGEAESVKEFLEKNNNADLRSADLRSADLSYADLRSADLSSADLCYAERSLKTKGLLCAGWMAGNSMQQRFSCL